MATLGEIRVHGVGISTGVGTRAVLQHRQVATPEAVLANGMGAHRIACRVVDIEIVVMGGVLGIGLTVDILTEGIPMVEVMELGEIGT
jgi:hypothetical protein